MDMKLIRTNWKVILIVFFLIILVLALALIPKWQVKVSGITNNTERFEAENEARKTIAQIIGGAAILIGLYFSWRTLESQRETLKLQLNDLNATREGQITERFTRAIDQIGARRSDGGPNLEVRLGGIYALERIAKDSPNDHWTVMEVLTSYVRENSPISLADYQLILNNESPDNQSRKKQILRLSVDIQAILTIIGRRVSKYDRNKELLLMHDTHLAAASLYKANLINAFFMGSNLEYALLTQSNLQGTTLIETNLEGADLDGANLEGANLVGANLSEALIVKTNFKRANLEGVNFERANLEEANFEGANLKRTTGLTIEQLSTTKSLYKAKLPEECLAGGTKQRYKLTDEVEWDYWEGGEEIDCLQEIKEKHPELLEEPK